MEADGLVYLFCGGRVNMDRRSCGVDGEDKICGRCGGGVLVSCHIYIKVTMESVAKWREDICCIDVDFGVVGSYTL